MTPNVYRAPAALLQDLGITEPDEINIEAIAQYCGATIVYETLKGAAARIIGHGDRAIITVDSRASRPRQRFSGGHELGHWLWDRGKVAFACNEETFHTEWAKKSAEQQANRYSADLLLPEFMFCPKAYGREITFSTVKELAELFQTSLTATAIRLVELGSFPAMVVCTEHGKRKWFVRGPEIPESLWPSETLRSGTVAHEILSGRQLEKGPLDVYADQWFDYQGADRHGVREDSLRISPSLVLSILWWKDERPLIEISGLEEN